MMSAGAGLHGHHAPWLGGEEGQEPTLRELLAQHDGAARVGPINLEMGLAVSRPMVLASPMDASLRWSQHLHLGTSMPSRGVHPIAVVCRAASPLCGRMPRPRVMGSFRPKAGDRVRPPNDPAQRPLAAAALRAGQACRLARIKGANCRGPACARRTAAGLCAAWKLRARPPPYPAIVDRLGRAGALNGSGLCRALGRTHTSTRRSPLGPQP